VEWGQIGYVTIQERKQKKLAEKAIKCTMLGYAEDHSGDTYRLYNPANDTVIMSRDVRWEDWHGLPHAAHDLRMFDLEKETPEEVGEAEIPAGPNVIPNTPDNTNQQGAQTADAEDDDQAGDQGDGNQQPELIPPDPIDIDVADAQEDVGTPVAAPTPVAMDRGGLRREVRALQIDPTSTFVPAEAGEDGMVTRQQAGNIIDDDSYLVHDHTALTASLTSDPNEPNGWKQVATHPDREKWYEATKKEAENFFKRGVWKKIHRSEVPNGRKPIGTKWVYKLKVEPDKSLRWKARNVILGFRMNPMLGDYAEVFSPTANDVTLRVILIYALHRGWSAHAIDIEAAFLESELEERCFVEWPEGLVELGFISADEKLTTCIELMRAQYGTKTGPRCWYKKLNKILAAIGLVRSKIDPCTFFGHDKGGSLNLIVAFFVDDGTCVGTKEALTAFKLKIAEFVNITDQGPIKKLLGAWYERKRDDNGEFFELSMTTFAEALVEDFETEIGQKVKEATTPAFPGTNLLRQKETNPIKIDAYQSFNGWLMWFTRQVAPQCCNAIRELARGADNPGEEHWRAMGRAVGFVKANAHLTLRYREPKELRTISWADSSFAPNKDDRKSVSGTVVTVGGVPVLISSNTQKCVTLSSTESELVALTACAKETKYVQMVLEEIDGNANRPAYIHEDNTGAMFLAENQQVGGRTKHIDIRHFYIRELMEDKEVYDDNERKLHANDGDDNNAHNGIDDHDEKVQEPRVEKRWIELRYVKSENNYADIATKNVDASTFESLGSRIANGMLLD